jgi:hypothetical protein
LIVTETLGSGEPSSVRVTVPVTVPVPWARASRGARHSANMETITRTVRNFPDTGCGIESPHIGGWLVKAGSLARDT